MPSELLQDSDSSLATIGPHWPSSYPEYLSPHQGKSEQQRIVWARLLSQRSNLAKSLREQKERYEALRRELNPRTTQAESSHDPLYRDIAALMGRRTPRRAPTSTGGSSSPMLSLHLKLISSAWIGGGAATVGGFNGTRGVKNTRRS